eukprot:GHVU01218756.1.p3 GENE.GHVU01218756.1~~GHVU01218756.1.p3  ORF type:complete len:112 (-),score=26.62 GHVU01218756.1:216-551(-)
MIITPAVEQQIWDLLEGWGLQQRFRLAAPVRPTEQRGEGEALALPEAAAMPMTGKRKEERAPLRGTRKDEAAVQQAERRRSSASTGVPSSVHPADRPARRFQQPPPSTSDT